VELKNSPDIRIWYHAAGKFLPLEAPRVVYFVTANKSLNHSFLEYLKGILKKTVLIR